MALTVRERSVAKPVKGFAESASPTVRMGLGSIRIGARFYPVTAFVPPLLPLAAAARRRRAIRRKSFDRGDIARDRVSLL